MFSVESICEKRVYSVGFTGSTLLRHWKCLEMRAYPYSIIEEYVEKEYKCRVKSGSVVVCRTSVEKCRNVL